MRNVKIGYHNLDSFRGGEPLCGFIPHDDPAVYFSMRSKALFQAIGKDPDNLAWELGTLPGGRWALAHAQPIEEGTPYAYEVEE